MKYRELEPELDDKTLHVLALDKDENILGHATVSEGWPGYDREKSLSQAYLSLFNSLKTSDNLNHVNKFAVKLPNYAVR